MHRGFFDPPDIMDSSPDNSWRAPPQQPDCVSYEIGRWPPFLYGIPLHSGFRDGDGGGGHDLDVALATRAEGGALGGDPFAGPGAVVQGFDHGAVVGRLRGRHQRLVRVRLARDGVEEEIEGVRPGGGELRPRLFAVRAGNFLA